MPSLKKKLPFRPNVCMIVVNRRGKIFLGERAGEPGVWQLPQGGAEPELTQEENVLRELYEELGAPKKYFKIRRKLRARHRYEWRTPPRYAKGRWRGQSQTFWLVEYQGSNKDINLGRFHREFDNFQWCSLSEVLALAEPRRVRGYRKALAEIRLPATRAA